jgi:hypothetical protein
MPLSLPVISLSLHHEMCRECVKHEEVNKNKTLVRKPEGKSLVRPKHRWDDDNGWNLWTGFIWLRIGTGDWLLLRR